MFLDAALSDVLGIHCYQFILNTLVRWNYVIPKDKRLRQDQLQVSHNRSQALTDARHQHVIYTEIAEKCLNMKVFVSIHLLLRVAYLAQPIHLRYLDRNRPFLDFKIPQ
jgi:hypothetical protein